RLMALDLSLDAWVFHPQLADAVDLARAFPRANIIVGHVGGPLGYGPYAGKRDAVFAAWKAGIIELARCPNVVMKLGGMMMRLAAYDYGARPAPPSSAELADYWRPYVETCIERFGAARSMFESNFPVDKMGIGHAALAGLDGAFGIHDRLFHTVPLTLLAIAEAPGPRPLALGRLLGGLGRRRRDGAAGRFPLRIVGERRRTAEAVEGEDHRGHALEHETIVGDEDERAIEFGEAVLEDLERRDVEVVGGLVEDEEIGGLAHQARDEDA